MKDFSLEKYEELCSILANTNYDIYSVKQYLLSNPSKNFVILRHDVDSRPYRSLRMAEMEYKFGLSATYYFRHTPDVFKPEFILKIQDLGHEIGYHYETLSAANGDFVKAIKKFEIDLADFRKICEIKTICMHGSPLSKFDNRDLWKKYDFKDFDIIGEAYLSMNSDLNYFSDTGWKWDQQHKIRDILTTDPPQVTIKSTDELILTIKKRLLPNFYILIHPANWAVNSKEWYITWFQNQLCNYAKILLKARRRSS